MQVVHTEDCPVTWSTSISNIGSGSQIYGSFLEEFPASHEDTVGDEHCFSSLDGQSVRKDHPDLRGHAMCMHP